MISNLEDKIKGGLLGQPGFWSLSDVINVLIALSKKLDSISAKIDQLDAKVDELVKAKK